MRRLNGAQARFALALAVSGSLHVWFAFGLGIAVPERPPLPTVASLTAHLATVAAPSATETPPQSSESADSGNSQNSSAVSERIPERALRPSTRGENRAPPPAANDQDMPAVVLPHAGDPIYYPAHELDVYPALRAPIRLEYPERAARDQVAGRVLIVLLLDEAGGVDRASIVTAEPPGYFEDAVGSAFAATRFFPAQKSGRAVKSRVLIHVNYEPGAAGGTLR